MPTTTLIEFLPGRPLGVLDIDLAHLLSTTARRINQTARRNGIPEQGDEYRYKLSKEEFRCLEERRGFRNTHGGRRYSPFVYTFKGTCYIISRLRLNLSREKRNEILRLFDESDLHVFDYGYNRREEKFGDLLRIVLEGIDEIQCHSPVSIEGKKYFIDFVLKNHRIAIEVDEAYHVTRRAIDETRQRIIEKQYGFRFVRIGKGDNQLKKLNEILRFLIGRLPD